MRTRLTLDDDVYEAALQLSKSSGAHLGKVVSELARRELKRAAPAAARNARRFPVFDVAPGTPRMNLESIDKFIEEEGLF